MSTFARGVPPDDDTPVFVISVAAQLAGMHAQTLRQYDRLGLVSPSRTRGGGRRYSPRDVARLREVQRLSQDEGISLAGIRRIMFLEDQLAGLQAQLKDLVSRVELAEGAQRSERVFAAGRAGEVVAVRPGRRPARVPSSAGGSSAGALVVWRPHQ